MRYKVIFIGFLIYGLFIRILDAQTFDFEVQNGEISGCIPHTVTLKNTSSDISNYTFTWKWGVGKSSTSITDVVATFAEAGKHTVELKIYDLNSNLVQTVTKTDYITVFNDPYVTIAPEGLQACVNTPVTYNIADVTSDTTIVKYTWNFGDTKTATYTTGDDRVHYYTRKGEFFPSLFVYDANGCDNTSNSPSIKVNISDEKPNAVFDVDQNYACSEQLHVVFENKSINTLPIKEYIWNYADGSPADTIENTNHTYTSYGKFFPILKVVAENGCYALAGKSVELKEYNLDIAISDYAKPITDANLACPGDLVFSLVSTGIDAQTSIQWDFDVDGSIDNEDTTSVTRNYTSGTYIVKATISDNETCFAEVTKTFTVEEPINPDFSPHNFFICDPLQDFNMTATSNANVSGVVYDWRFDGEFIDYTGVGQTYAFDPEIGGSYSTTLTATSENECVEKVTESELFLEWPMMNFKLTTKSGCKPLTITYDTDVSYDPKQYDNITSIEWDFDGDGTIDTTTTDTAVNPSFTFTEVGVYTARVYLTTAHGCKDVLIIQDGGYDVDRVVSVGDTVPVKFELSDLELCASDTLLLFDDSGLRTNKDTITATFTNNRGSSNSGNTPLTLSEDTIGVFQFNTLSDSTGYHDLDIELSYHGCKSYYSVQDTINIKGPLSFPSIQFSCDEPFDYNFTADMLGDVERMEWRVYRYDETTGDTLERIATLNNQLLENESFLFDFKPYETDERDNYKLILWSENTANGCEFDDGESIIKVRDVNTEFTLNDDTPCLDQVLFLNYHDSTRDDDYLRWTLDLMNGSPVRQGTLSSEISLNNLFGLENDVLGIHSIELEAEDVNGCKDMYQKFLKVYKPDATNITASVEEECINFSSDFSVAVETDTNIVSYRWYLRDIGNFNDYRETTIPNITGNYSTYGYKDIAIVVSDILGCEDSLVMPDLIKPVAPNVDFQPKAYKYCRNVPAEFTIFDNDPERQFADTYVWNFGDTDELVETTETKATHEYKDTSGYFLVKLVGEITSPATGKTCKDSVVKQIEYKNLHVKLDLENNSACFQPNGANRPLINVNALSTTDENALGNRVIWSKGDSQGMNYEIISTDSTVDVIDLGSVTGVSYYIKVELTNTGYYGCETIADSQMVMVFDPNVEVHIDKETVCLGDEVTFTIDPSQNLNLLPHFWAMGDGSNIELNEEFTYTFESLPVDEYFLVELIVEQERGENKTTCPPKAYPQKVYVYSVESGFDRGLDDLDTAGCAPLTVDFINTSVGNKNKYTWYINSTEFSTIENPSYTFSQPNSLYDITLVLNSGICTHDVVKQVRTLKLPDVDFIGDSAMCDNATQILEVNLESDSIIAWSTHQTPSMSLNMDEYASVSPINDSSALLEMERSGYVYVDLMSGEGCLGRDSLYIYVQNKPYYTGAPNSDLQYYPDQNKQNSLETVKGAITQRLIVGEIYNVNNDSLSGVNYTWKYNDSGDENYLSCYNCSSPDLDLTCGYTFGQVACDEIPESLSYTVYMTDDLGCYAEEEIVHFLIDREMMVGVPSAFTPNGDGTNDIFRARGWAIKEFVELRVYNRWGQLVFETSDISEGWDGTYNGKEQNVDTYVYVLKAIDYSDNEFEDKGYFNLLR